MRKALIALLALAVLAAGGVDAWLLSRDESGRGLPTPSGSAALPAVRADGSYRVGGLPAAEKAAVTAAVAALPAALSYDYRSLPAGLDRATALMTPNFGQDFRKTFAATTQALAIQKKAITSALVRAAGVIGQVSRDRVTCLLYVDQVLISSTVKKAGDPLQVRQNRVHVVMRRIGGSWLVDGIEPF